MASRVVSCPNCGKKNRVPAVATGVPHCGNCHRPLPWVADATDDDFGTIAEGSSIPVLVDLWAPWCGPCRMVSPALEQIASEYAGRVKLVKVNVDQTPRLSDRFAVRAVPTLLLMRGDRVLARQAGAAPLPALRAWLDRGLAGTGAATEPGRRGRKDSSRS